MLAATTTGRLASSDPNLQNIPIKSEDGKDIRKAFVAKKDHVLISADYNQIEMRIIADLADVKGLKKAFKNNEDIHSLTASQIFNIDIKKVNIDLLAFYTRPHHSSHFQISLLFLTCGDHDRNIIF